MDHIVLGSILASALAAAAAGFLAVKDSAVFGVLRQNLTRLRELKNKHAAETDAREKAALEAVILQCEALRKKWILNESDLRFLENTHRLAEAVAAAYYPNSPLPMAEARIGALLEAFLNLKKRLLVLASMKGIEAVTHFRLRHIAFLSKAWNIKKEWEASRAAKFVKKFKIHILVDWALFVYRCFDIGFWAVKMLRHVLYDQVFRILLIGWHLEVGELVSAAYREKTAATDAEAEKVAASLEEFPQPLDSLEKSLPTRVRVMADATRSDILYKLSELEWREAGIVYERLAADIARFYHPLSENPLYEARIFRLLTSAARFADAIAALQNYPLVDKTLSLRVRHILWAKNAADSLANNPLVTWMKKHRLGQIVKISSLVFKTIKQGTPAALFKNIAFSLAQEGAKRWVCLYLLEKIALEANAIYKEEPAMDRENL